MNSDNDFDVIVVGGGGAGLAAAVTAADGGTRVLLVEAADRVGGVTALAGGSFMAAGTPAQVAAGYLDDNVDEFYDYWMTFNAWDADPAVARRFCERATPTMAWLVGLGVEYAPQNIYRAGLERVPRTHRPTGGGLAIVHAMQSAASKLGIEIAVGNRVDSLLVEDGRVVGVNARGEQLRAGAVVITTGGFGHNPELIKQHFPHAFSDTGDVWSPSPDTCVGDGLKLGTDVGAKATGTNRGELLLTPGFSHDIEPFAPGWLVYINQAGQRFVSEQAPHTVITPLTLKQGGTCWVIMDDVALRSAVAPEDKRFGSGSWVNDILLTQVATGRVKTGDSIEDLAATTGMPAPALAATVSRYNAACKNGFDDQFFKDPAALKPIATAPFYAVKMTPSVVVVTGYGLRIDPDGHVLSAIDGQPIPGLYAAGEVTGSVIGSQYLGGGNAIGSALIFGRIAGQTAVSDQARYSE